MEHRSTPPNLPADKAFQFHSQYFEIFDLDIDINRMITIESTLFFILKILTHFQNTSFILKLQTSFFLSLFL